MSHTNFLGIPVEGDIHRSNRVDQRPVEEFGPILRAVLNDERIEAVRWEQYTPYFNDGDVCEFRIHELSVKPAGESVPRDDYEDGFIDHWSLGYESERGMPHLAPLKEATAELNRAVAGGAFYDALLDAFGDHAEITVTGAGITVEFYEHD